MVGHASLERKRLIMSRALASVLAALMLILVAGTPGDALAGGQAGPGATDAVDTPASFALFGPAASDDWAAHAGSAEAAAVIERARGGLTRPPGAIPVTHTEGTLPGRGIREISSRAREDFGITLSLALAYRITGDRLYAERAEAYLLAWAGTYRWSFNPIDETGFDTLIMATDLVDGALTPDGKARIDGFWRRLSVGYLDAMDGTPINAATNWQSHRIKLATLSAYRVGDPALIERARAAYRRHVSTNILADGSVHDFHERDAIHYVTYNLDPLMTAALAAQRHGEDWFGWRNSAGAGARDAVVWLVPYAEGRLTHEEFVNSSIKFDADRARVGQPGYAGMWDRAGAVNTLALAGLLDPQFCQQGPLLERATGRSAALWIDWMRRASAGGTACRPAGVRAAHFGMTLEGEAVTAYTLFNRSGASATILDFGGTIVDLRVPDRHGTPGNVVLAFADLAGWESVGNANAIVGRFANRIRGGFDLDGVHYPLQQNAAGITSHGGNPPYSKRIWTVAPPGPEDGASVTLTLDSPSGDQGFPGTLRISATYRLSDDNALSLDLRATTDQPTVINLTNHIYFNLNGNSTTSVAGHRLQMLSDRVAFRDALNVPSGALVTVADTPLDLRTARSIAELIEAASDPRFAAPVVDGPAAGRPRMFDYAYLLEEAPDQANRPVARLEDDISGRVMELSTSEPAIQVYVTDNTRPGLLSDVGRPLSPWPAVALETQHLPDSPNQPSFPTTVLRPGEVYRSTTVWSFRTR